jgi:ABC-type transport system involved in multi-copper enzyme maturation permease subunit
MKMLLWKDYRLNRLVLVLGATLLLGPYLVLLLWSAYSPDVPRGFYRDSKFWAGFLLTGSVTSLIFSELALALLAGNAFTCERADRSAEFLGYLPPSRLRILTSKAILVWSAAGLVWGVNLLAVTAAPVISAIGKNELTANESFSIAAFFLATVATGVMFLGTGWLASCILDSPTFASATGLMTPLLLFCSFQILHVLFDWPGPEIIKELYTGSCLVVGLLCFAAGTVYYLRRVEP